MTEPVAPRRERPLLVTIASSLLAAGALAAALFSARAKPEAVVIGLPGRHDSNEVGQRLADCIDCHVPFVGTPGSRCLAPGCHGELATGTPPRDGKAMPVRFHAALRAHECSRCHTEHSDAPNAWQREFSHELIPEGDRQRCSRCHSAVGVSGHPRTDAVSCDLCHGFDAWRGVKMEHRRVGSQPCDLCHSPPETTAHASIAGTCTDCHGSSSWKEVTKGSR